MTTNERKGTMSTDTRMVFEVEPSSDGRSSRDSVERFARRRPGLTGEVFRGVDLIPAGEAYNARQSAWPPAEVFADPDRAEEQHALVEAGRGEDETYTETYDRLRREEFANREENR